MARIVLVTEGDSPLGAALVGLLGARGCSVVSTVGPSASVPSGVGSERRTMVLRWNRRSAASAHTVLLSILNSFDQLDDALILEPQIDARFPLAQAPTADIERGYDEAKGPALLAREVLGHFAKRGSGIMAMVTGLAAQGSIGRALQESFRGLASSLLTHSGDSGVLVNGFQPGEAAVEEYASFVDRTLEERARKTGGRWYACQSRPGLFLGGRSRRA